MLKFTGWKVAGSASWLMADLATMSARITSSTVRIVAPSCSLTKYRSVVSLNCPQKALFKETCSGIIHRDQQQARARTAPALPSMQTTVTSSHIVSGCSAHRTALPGNYIRGHHVAGQKIKNAHNCWNAGAPAGPNRRLLTRALSSSRLGLCLHVGSRHLYVQPRYKGAIGRP